MSETLHIQMEQYINIMKNHVFAAYLLFSLYLFLCYREDITYRLPELDQRGSDEENMDSETSNSTESLLDDKPVHVEKEGQY